MARAMARSTNVKGRTSSVASRRAMLVPSPARVAKVATISRSLRQETASPKRVNVSRRAPAVQVEMAWKRDGGLEEQRGEHQHGGEAVQRGFQAPRGGSARRPDQPEHGVDQADGDAHPRREGSGFGQCAQQESACQAEQRAADNRQERGGGFQESGHPRAKAGQAARRLGWEPGQTTPSPFPCGLHELAGRELHRPARPTRVATRQPPQAL